ncbi:uncharacterized protein ACHE_10490S [Aspergillus chevalieri]|uniref:Uncharacterized protein n=1 Tax=Aspergillus chevalieri TaxID=182096 RepID=A0A7R7ZIB5_ASPCH|nr:uncharacterized protein ACHE_10490S [Aspergillus chevalieri]BCR83088.1 hypothetical protein ACHE_10490S [Aspergillus chevalieri]
MSCSCPGPLNHHHLTIFNCFNHFPLLAATLSVNRLAASFPGLSAREKSNDRPTPPDFNASPEYFRRACLYPSLSSHCFDLPSFDSLLLLTPFSILYYILSLLLLLSPLPLSVPHPLTNRKNPVLACERFLRHSSLPHM